MSLQQEITKYIKKMTFTLKAEEELRLVLKKKLTKKEFKLLEAWSHEVSQPEIMEKLNLQEERYQEMRQHLIKKLNQEKLKQHLYVD
jgi:FixJ family two-component response regulator